VIRPIRLAFYIAVAAFAILILDSLIRAPDTVDGKVIPWDLVMRILVAAVLALVGFVGFFMGLRSAKPERLSIFRGIVIVLLYAALNYAPMVFSQKVTMEIDKAGRIVSSSPAWWPLLSVLEPLVLPYVLAVVVTRLPYARLSEGA
jgi:hypothetical protein